MNEYKELLLPIILAVFSSGGLFSFATFIISRYDNKKGVEKQLKELNIKLDNKIDEVNQNVDTKIAALSNKVDENQAILARTHILRFSDDLKNGITHSDEYFEQQLDDIKTYNLYCANHPNFKNERTVMSSEFIKRRYNEEQFGDIPN